LTGGTNDTYKADDVNCMGGAVLGENRGVSSIVENCIISNNYSSQGTAAKCDLFSCRVVGNRSANNGSGVRQGNAYGCYFSNNRGSSVLSYCKYVWNCTIMRDNRNSAGDSSTSIGNTMDGGSILNTFVGYTLNASGDNQVTISNCVVDENVNRLPMGGNVITSGIARVDISKQLFTDYGLPVIGSNAAIDAGDFSMNTNYLGNTDARGFQRVMNGAMDIGCYEADWRGVYAALLSASARFRVTEAGEMVMAAENSVEIADGGLEVEWTGREGRTTMYSFAVRVEGGGTLAISDGRETVALVTASDGEKIVSVANRQEKAVFRFEFEPGAGENPGKAVLGPFSRMGCGFSVLVR
jgi:hypothetical protein